MTIARGLTGAMLALVTMTAQAATPPSPMLTKAKKLIASHMVDPSSLQYKNKLGGYTGFQTFAYEPTVLKGVLSMNSEEGMAFYGDDGGDAMDRSDDATRANAGILAVCLGSPA